MCYFFATGIPSIVGLLHYFLELLHIVNPINVCFADIGPKAKRKNPLFDSSLQVEVVVLDVSLQLVPAAPKPTLAYDVRLAV